VRTSDVFAQRRQRIVGSAVGVGPHVGDQTDGSPAGDLLAFVQPLRDLHRPPHRKTEAPGGGLLELRRDERRRRRLLALGAFDAAAWTAFLVISLNRARLKSTLPLPGFNSWSRCHEIASPSRSGSAARYTRSAARVAFFRSPSVFSFPFRTSYVGR